MTLKIKRNKQGNVRNKIIVCSCSLNQEKNKECERKSKSIKEDVINNIIITSISKKINSIINNKKLEEITLKEFEKSTTSVLDNQVEMLKKKVSKTDKAISSLYEDYSNRIIEEEDYRRFYQSEVDRRNTLKSEINKLVKQKEQKPTISISILFFKISKIISFNAGLESKIPDQPLSTYSLTTLKLFFLA